jgi:hypothetical protein
LDSQINLIDQLKPQYFWDVDITKLDENVGRRLIIDRVFSLGSLQEINLIVKHYGRQEVINVICNLNYLDLKTLNFAMKLFNLTKNDFVCSSRKQSISRHWNS